MTQFKYKIITINPTPSNHYDIIDDTKILENHLNEGWIIDRETVIPCSVSAPAYRGLSSIIYILYKNYENI